ncbi:hypothetical protein B296_00025728, partial [Ensete ventricosum]
LDKSPTACRRGRCTPVGYCVCIGTSSVASCQGLGGTVHRSAAASTMPRHLSPAVRGQGVSFACRLLRLPWHVARCQLSGVMGLSYMGHVVATVPNKSPIAYRRGRYMPVDCCVFPGTSPVASCQGCQGSGGVVRLSTIVSALTHHSLPAVRGRGAGLARQHCYAAHYQGGQLVGCRVVRGYPEVGSSGGRRLDVVELRRGRDGDTMFFATSD